ncbi:MAG: tail sheath [Wendovervirus sonii]|uniref:Tail sheath n=1 Tax=phage Lak_Megaphage_Sonny TaxID=3109229 RepID=A0ABZ0Z6V5_9CAUD|nr:MAG: tail sheath [phage Lak_Megaphage_Sonny]
MGKLSIDLNSLKAAGIYTLEFDNTKRQVNENINSLRLVTGFSNKGPFNRPVLLTVDTDRLSIFGDIDSKMEYKGCYFNRYLRTLLTGGPVIALNLLKVDERYNGPDQVNYTALSLDAGTANPRVIVDSSQNKYGQYDYLAEGIDNIIYGTNKGSNIPFVGQTPFASLYDRSRFWVANKELLTYAAMRDLKKDHNFDTYEEANLLNFANVGTEEFSLLIYKVNGMNGYDVTAESWYGGKENIPFGWIRPYDYISDYFIQVICIKGNWSNYPVLSTDPIWGSFFDRKGIIKSMIPSFLRTEGVNILGNWTGCIIPDFIDKQGSNLSIEKRINAQTESTGLLMSFNNDLANVLTYDYTGKDGDESDPDSGCWGLDIDGDMEVEEGENLAKYIVDMCGHDVFIEKTPKQYTWVEQEINDLIEADSSLLHKSRRNPTQSPSNPVYRISVPSNPSIDISCRTSTDTILVKPGVYVDASLLKDFNPMIDTSVLTDSLIGKLVNDKYYILSEQGTMSGKKLANIKQSSYKYSNVDTSVGIAEVYLTYGSEDRRITYMFEYITENNKEYITNISDAVMEYKNTNIGNEQDEPYYGINFLSYNYVRTSADDDDVEHKITSVYYFNDPILWDFEDGKPHRPVDENTKNMFIITDKNQCKDSIIKVNDYVRNITYNNKIGETTEYKLIPGLARIIKKQFISYQDGKLMYKGTGYKYNGPVMDHDNGGRGVYLITATSPVLIQDNEIIRQLPITDDAISHSLRFIPMKGLTISSRHRPGYDEDGNLNIEKGIKKIYGMLNDEGIRRGLLNNQMVNFRYVVDSMSYGLGDELGGKVELSKLAYDRKKTTAVLNLPSARQFATSSNPYFCDTYMPGIDAKKPLNTKYIPEGGNTEMGATMIFSLPSVEHGASFTACFWPNVIYTENGKTISVPPAADVTNVLNRKFTGLNNPYCICANQTGILENKYITGLEFYADIKDREYLEPFGVNTIIKEDGNIMIYGNQTAYQSVKSDLNKLHVRENLNTAEIECENVLKKYNFLYNTPAVRANITQLLTAPLQVMKTSGALLNFEIICNETNNTAEVIEADSCIVEVNLWVNHGMEKIVQVFTLNRYDSSMEK